MASAVGFTSPEDIPEFLGKENVKELLFFCNKDQLILLAKHFGLEISTGCKKGELLLKVITALQMSESELENLEASESKSVVEMVELERLKLERFKLEKEYEEKEKEREEKEKEREERGKERAHEMEVLRLKASHRRSNSRSSSSSSSSEERFNLISAIKLVPNFSEREVVEFFLSFEMLARRLNWPKDKWTTIIQCRFIGKAQKVYSTLSDEVSADYDKVKAAVLKSYELVPEAYRQKFREMKKQLNQTFVEFARDKERAFEDWCRSKEADNFEKLRMLVLNEEFRNCIPREIKVHLEDGKVDDLYKSARLADEYSIAHKFSFRSKFSSFQQGFKGSGQGKSKEGTGVNSSPKEVKKDVECYFCHKKGHMRRECPALKPQGASKLPSEKKPVGLIGKFSSGKRECRQQRIKHKGFENFISNGTVIVNPDAQGTSVGVTILRDTGAVQSLILESVLPEGAEVSKEDYVLVGGFPDTVTPCPLLDVFLDCNLVNSNCKLAVVPSLPVEGVELLLANDLAGGKVSTNPYVSTLPVVEDSDTLDESQFLSPVSVVTRSRAKGVDMEKPLDLSDSWLARGLEERTDHEVVAGEKPKGQEINWSKEALVKAQSEDVSVALLKEHALEGDEVELVKPQYVMKDDVLFRRSRAVRSPAKDVEVLEQVVVPEKYQVDILKEAHEGLVGGHLGIRKTLDKVSRNFYWNGIKRDVKKYVKTCPVCQKVGNPNQKITKVPLVPIPSVGEPFENVVVDVAGPLPRTKKGFEYMLTIMDRVSRYPEAIPLRKINAKVVIEALIQFFSKFGMPRVVQTDRGTNFTSKYFQEKMKEFGIKHVTSSAYHPQSQGVVERFHQTLKTMMRKYCKSNEAEWDQSIPYLLFAIRSSVNESLGVSPFDMIFGHNVRGPLDLIREEWESANTDTNLIDYIDKFKSKIHQTWEFANSNLSKSQRVMKDTYDIKSKQRSFQVGQRVLALIPIPGNPLTAKFSGPFSVEKKINDTTYVLATPDRRKKYQTCHINMLKAYHDRESPSPCLAMVVEAVDRQEVEANWPSTNSEVLQNLDSSFVHLPPNQRTDLINLISKYKCVFKDSPGRTDLLLHDVEVDNVSPIKQHPYRLHPQKEKIVEEEVQYMLDHNLIVQSNSPWSSPIVLVKKSDNKYRLCFDYRKLNAVTVTDTFPIPRLDDCIDQVGHAKFLSKFDLLKGYWQVGLTDRARTVSAFVTKNGLYECCVMPFGMKNSSATFQRLMNIVTRDLKGCIVYIDDVVIFSDDWETHLERVEAFFQAVKDAGLVINLTKCDFASAKVKFLGHEIGLGQLLPVDANVKAIYDFPVPSCRKHVRSFLGMANFYRRFIRNYSDLSLPLTELLKKQNKFQWTNECQTAFDKLKAVLANYPVLSPPDWTKPFILATDASDTGVGGVLLQKDDAGIEHPVSYFSKKLSACQRKYSTIEKEAFAVIMALQHFEVYLSGGGNPIEVRTDHNPLVFLNKFKNKNARLTRWQILLQEWNLSIKHISGKSNILPDALSRM